MGQRFPTTAFANLLFLYGQPLTATQLDCILNRNWLRIRKESLGSITQMVIKEAEIRTLDVEKLERKGSYLPMIPFSEGGGNNHYADEVNGPICTTHRAPSFILSAHRLLFPLTFFFYYFFSSIVVHILYVNAVNAPLSRRFEEQLTLLCSTFCFFTRHFNLLFDVPFAAKCSSVRRRRPSRSIHFSQ